MGRRSYAKYDSKVHDKRGGMNKASFVNRGVDHGQRCEGTYWETIEQG